MFINIHTHQAAVGFAIQNLHQDFDRVELAGRYSIGLHPWYVHAATWQQEMGHLRLSSQKGNVLAIGECGLDRACSTDYSLQQEVFGAQVQWANQINKPIIVHCVRAHEDVLQLLKQAQNKVPVIFHGFNKSLALARKIVQQGHWLSFGKVLEHERMQAVFAALPINNIFLETDDAVITIEETYQLAASILQIGTNELSLQLQTNAATVFGAAQLLI